jgi:hypothetical protein
VPPLEISSSGHSDWSIVADLSQILVEKVFGIMKRLKTQAGIVPTLSRTAPFDLRASTMFASRF